jgi:hypothetical protein
VISTIWPKQEEQFFELGLLNSEKKTNGYFTYDNSTITINATTSWYIYLSNHMSTDQKVVIRIKLLNSTNKLPDDKLHQSSPSSTLYEIPILLYKGQTINLPFQWSISKTKYQDGTINIENIIINGDTANVNATSTNSRFRIVFELWVYNNTIGDYVYGWDTGKESLSASIYILFTLVSTQS